MDKFWKLFEQSVIMQSILTLMVVGAFIYLVCTGRQIPELLVNTVGLTFGFFFGSKVGYWQKNAKDG